VTNQNQELKRAGLKVTLPRVKILQMFEDESFAHISAEEVYKQLQETGEDVGLATVYRVLTQFEAAGLITKHNFDGNHAIYELTTDDHHDHMVNVKTGEVIEFVDPVIEARQHDIAKEHGFEIVDHSLVLYVQPLNTKKAPKV
jgi:Fur family ferric uptake transcriptional regulator